MRYFSSLKAGSPPLVPIAMSYGGRRRGQPRRERTRGERNATRLTVVDKLNPFEEELDEGLVVDCIIKTKQ